MIGVKRDKRRKNCEDYRKMIGKIMSLEKIKRMIEIRMKGERIEVELRKKKYIK